jgi:Cu(I)/Ag(I) efflux system membrane protein CusA/SilA
MGVDWNASGAQIPLGQVARVTFSHGPAMMLVTRMARLRGTSTSVSQTPTMAASSKADKLLHDKLLCLRITFRSVGEYELELRAKQRLQLILPVVFFVILLYLVFHSVAETSS